MLPKRIPFNQVAFAMLLGVGGGIYIYKPMFQPQLKTTSETGNKGQDAVVEHKTSAAK